MDPTPWRESRVYCSIRKFYFLGGSIDLLDCYVICHCLITENLLLVQQAPTESLLKRWDVISVCKGGFGTTGVCFWHLAD